MSWVAVGVAVVGGVVQHNQNKKGQDAANKANDASLAWQQQMYNQDRADRMPWMNAGKDALAQMQALNAGDLSKFYRSPDYQFAYDQGIQSLDRGAAARGAMFSGGADADKMRFASGLASQNYGTFYSRLSDLATGGNATAASLGANGQNTANSIGNLLTQNAQNRMSTYQQQGNNWAGVLGAVGNGYNYWRNSRPQGS